MAKSKDKNGKSNRNDAADNKNKSAEMSAKTDSKQKSNNANDNAR